MDQNLILLGIKKCKILTYYIYIYIYFFFFFKVRVVM